MGEKTGILWTDHTFNPWWGCKKISPACDHCYAEREAKRFGFPGLWNGERRTFGDDHWKQPIKWNFDAKKAGEVHRVFCGSMCDIFESDQKLDSLRNKVYDLISLTPNLEWLLLTKRAENISKMLPVMWMMNPPSNVRVMITAENQEMLDRRLPHLLQWNGKNGISIEPILSSIVFPENAKIDWVIVGGESGSEARPVHPNYVTRIFHQCQKMNIPFFFKQWGEWLPMSEEDLQIKHILDDKKIPAIRFSDGQVCIRVGRNESGHLLYGKTIQEFPRK